MHLSHEDGDYISNFIDDRKRISQYDDLDTLKSYYDQGIDPPSFEAAGPRDTIFFNPKQTRAAIVTCGGLCPGINDVIRGIVLSLTYNYNVREIFGIRYGYKGLVERHGIEPKRLTPEVVDHITSLGGTILGSSRGPQDVGEMVDYMVKHGINLLFTIGGDGTQRGSLAIANEVEKRGLHIAVVGIPKTIDNDISYIQRTFGFETAFSVASEILNNAHAEAKGANNGVCMVKLMGRHSGFLAATAAVSSGEVNICLIPEVPFDLGPPNGFLAALEKRVLRRRHAVVVVAEGAGQEHLDLNDENKTDKSGNVVLGDIGTFLVDKAKKHFVERKIDASVRYIDPSYIVRSGPATPNDSMYCLRLAHNAVHAAMTGRTAMVVGFWHNFFTHIPIEAAVSRRKTVNPEGDLWLSVMETADQPHNMRNPD